MPELREMPISELHALAQSGLGPACGGEARADAYQQSECDSDRANLSAIRASRLMARSITGSLLIQFSYTIPICSLNRKSP